MPSVRVCSATPWEVQQVRDLIARQGGSVYMEIGSYMGGSLQNYGSAMPKGSWLIAVDRPHGATQAASLNAVAESLAPNYQTSVLLGDSHSDSLAQSVRELLAGKLVDTLFIDGDHSVPGCSRDLDLYAPLVRPGGLVLMHDCGGSEPCRPLGDKVLATIAGLHGVWKKYSAGRRRVMIQEWCGYGGFWV